MPIKLEATPVFSGYRPPCEDEDGLTPHQRQERRESLNRATMMVYDSTMTTEAAKRMMQMPIVDSRPDWTSNGSGRVRCANWRGGIWRGWRCWRRGNEQRRYSSFYRRRRCPRG